MKFNLKNRPEPKDYPKWKNRKLQTLKYFVDANEEWFEGFEAELRDIIAGKIEPEGVFAKGMCKEILGE